MTATLATASKTAQERTSQQHAPQPRPRPYNAQKPQINDDQAEALAEAIVRQAIEDWNMLLEAKQYAMEIDGDIVSLPAIRSFLAGRWCKAVMSSMTIDGADVLDGLMANLARVAKDYPDSNAAWYARLIGCDKMD